MRLMIWFARQSSCSTWNAFAGERGRACRCPGVRDVPAILLPDWQPDEKFANHEHHSNRALLCPVRPPRAAIAAMCSSMSSLEHGPQNRTTRVPVAKQRFQEANTRDWLTIIVNCVLPRWPDAIHNRNDPSRMETAPQNQLNRSFATPDGP